MWRSLIRRSLSVFSINEMIKNESYCRKKGLYSKADALRTGLNNIIKDYEMTTLGTQ